MQMLCLQWFAGPKRKTGASDVDADLGRPALGFHIVFAEIDIAMPALMVAILFAVGAVSGTVFRSPAAPRS